MFDLEVLRVFTSKLRSSVQGLPSVKFGPPACSPLLALATEYFATVCHMSWRYSADTQLDATRKIDNGSFAELAHCQLRTFA